MRPVNLIPPESRRGQRAPLRAGGLSYGLIAILVIALAGVTALVLTENSISEKEGELAALESQRQAAQAEASALAPYAEFAALREARLDTISSLAESRFDWERVLRELALVLPGDIWLMRVTGTATPSEALEGSDDQLRGGVAGPALSLVGCGASQEAVAGFAAALEDIDGVTRVGIARAQLPEDVTEGGSTDDCRTRDFISRFEITAAFDGAPVPSALPPAAPADAGTDGGVAETQATSASAEESAARQTEEAQQATNVIPGAVR